MRILVLHENQPCYLTESLFHGLREVLGSDCVDVPKMESMYAPLNSGIRKKLRGNGFTLYGLLDDLDELVAKRYAWRLELEKYDYIVLSHIWWQGYLLRDLLGRVAPEKIIILDGDDSSRIFPYKKNSILKYISLIPVLRKISYFKRELMHNNNFLENKIKIYPLSFSIPKCKVLDHVPSKTKNFTSHVIDDEVRKKIGECSGEKYLFQEEKDYYLDLRSSRFGVTTKRSGWDCLRHYELAANGCILCFRDLDLKKQSCAPHGLNSSNCISYYHAEDLLKKITALTQIEENEIRRKTFEWIRENTTIQKAKYFLDKIGG